ncbi:MAG: hypothetical protein ACRD44_14845, partial [Bryobacteraceae bacterium]
ERVATSQPAPRLAGTWIFIPPSAATAVSELYPPEYIELVITEHDGVLRGRYRGRYRIADRALSPDVTFQFQGRAGAGRLHWTGVGGAAGEVELTLKSERTVEVSWFSTQLGPLPGLTSGTAVLVRRQEP